MKTGYYDFNLSVLNFLIGLQKGSLLLKPYSKEFKNFDYSIFSLEQKITSSELGDIKPEVIFNSNKINNTLLFESTEAKVEIKAEEKQGKKSQLERYKNTKKENLSDIGLIPKVSLKSFDIPFIVTPLNIEGYIDFFKKNIEYKFPTLVFYFDDEKNKYFVELKHNKFSVAEVNNFFEKGISFGRLNMFIKYDFSKISEPEEKIKIFNHLALQLLKVLYKSKKGDVFTAEQLSKATFSDTLWDGLSVEMKTSIKRNIAKMIAELFITIPDLQKHCFYKEHGNSIQYKIILEDVNREITMRKYSKKMLDFINATIAPKLQIQLELDLFGSV